MPLAREVVQRPGRRARRLHPPDPAAPHQPRHRRGGHRARPLRAHPRARLPVVRRTGQDAAGGAVPGRLAPRGRTRHRPRPGHRGPAVVDRETRRSPAAPRPGRQRRAGHHRPGRAPHRTGRGDHQGGHARQGAPARPARRHRSTRRRQDAPDLPRRKVSPRTVGKTYTAPDGKTFRPSLFVTLTCPSYGRVGEDGTPADPAAYDYDRAARDALTFAALFDRFIQNLRRYLGYDVQYFAAVEPQRRLAPHIHLAMRGTVSRAELRRVLAATYHQVWWPERERGQVRRGRAARLGRGDRRLPRPGHRGSPAHLGPGPRRHRSAGRAVACGPVRGPVRRPGRARRVQGRGPVHRLPDQVPHQAGGRLPPGRRPTRSAPMPRGWPRRCGISRARRGARTGSGTASSPRTPGPAWSPAGARARPTTRITSATPGAGSWSRASGPARRWPTTAPTARTGCWPRSVFRQPTRPATPGNRSPRPIRTTWTTPGGYCMPSLTALDGKPRSTRPDEELPYRRPLIFRQPEGQHDGSAAGDGSTGTAGRGASSDPAGYQAAIRPASDRRAAHRIPQGWSLRPNQRIDSLRLHRCRPR